MSRTWLYFPGAAEGGAGDPIMTDTHDGHIILRGYELVRATYTDEYEPKVIAVYSPTDNLWYSREADGPTEGRPLVYVESEEGTDEVLGGTE